MDFDTAAFTSALTVECPVKGGVLPSYEEAERIKTVRLLIENPEQGNDEFTTDVVQTCRELLTVPIAAVSILEDTHAYFRACKGPVTKFKRNLSLCSYLLLPKDPTLIVIEDMLQDERSKQLPLVSGPPLLRFYAAVPLVASNGHILGALCMVDNKPRRFTVAECSLLINLGECVSRQLEGNKYTMLQEKAVSPMVRALEGSTAAVLLVDLAEPRWKVLFVNGKFQEKSRVREKTLKERGFWDVFECHDEDEVALFHRYESLFACGQDFSLSVRLRGHQGAMPLLYISFKLATQNTGVDEAAVPMSLPADIHTGPTSFSSRIYFGTIRKVVDARCHKQGPRSSQREVARKVHPPGGPTPPQPAPTPELGSARGHSGARKAQDIPGTSPCSSPLVGSPTIPVLRDALGLPMLPRCALTSAAAQKGPHQQQPLSKAADSKA